MRLVDERGHPGFMVDDPAHGRERSHFVGRQLFDGNSSSGRIRRRTPGILRRLGRRLCFRIWNPRRTSAVGAEQVRGNLLGIAAGPAADGLNVVLRLVFRRRSVLIHDLAQRLAPIGRAEQVIQRAPADARGIEMQIAGRRARVREQPGHGTSVPDVARVVIALGPAARLIPSLEAGDRIGERHAAGLHLHGAQPVRQSPVGIDRGQSQAGGGILLGLGHDGIFAPT
jgi:hypothetical protein